MGSGKNDSYMHGNIIEVRDADFFLKMYFLWKITSHDHHFSPEVSSKGHACSPVVELRRSKRIRKETDIGPDFIIAFLVEYGMFNEEFASAYIIE